MEIFTWSAFDYSNRKITKYAKKGNFLFVYFVFFMVMTL